MRSMTRSVTMLMALAAAAMVACGGCASDAALVSLTDAGDRFVNRTVGPEYETYVDRDPSLTIDEKRVRLANVAAFRRAVAVNK